MSAKCLKFMEKLYKVVDDPSTDSVTSWGPSGDSIVVWNPSDCCKVLGTNNFETLVRYGFIKVGEKPLQFACNDFVKGQPDRLEQISERFKKKLNDIYAKNVEHLTEVVKNCKTNSDRESVLNKYREDYGRKITAQIHQNLAKEFQKLMETAEMERKRRGEDLSKDVEDKLKSVADELNDLPNAADL